MQRTGIGEKVSQVSVKFSIITGFIRAVKSPKGELIEDDQIRIIRLLKTREVSSEELIWLSTIFRSEPRSDVLNN